MTVEEYPELDRTAELKSEYRDGEMVEMCASSLKHSQLKGRVFMRLDERLENGLCVTAIGPLRVRVNSRQFAYPDVVVVRGEPALTDEHRDTLANPKVIVEVLSPSTSDYVRGGKFALYRELASFEEYMLVFQDRVRVETYRRTAEGWLLRSFDGPEAVVTLHSLGISIPLTEIYKGIL